MATETHLPANLDTTPSESTPRIGLWQSFVDLTKLRLNALVILATAFGFVLASRHQIVEVGKAVATIVGTTLVALSASALNQVIEVRADRAMARTRHRPLAAGRLSIPAGLAFALASGGLGTWILVAGATLLAAQLALASLICYVAIYTPMKRRSSLNTLVGAVPGALPPVIGWAGATGEIEFGAWTLFAVLFFWQVPHFLAIAWMYREDYAKGGFRMLTVTDPSGRAAGRMAMVYTLGLLFISTLPSLAALSGWIYFTIAPFIGLIMLVPAWRFAQQPARAPARRLFLASLIYLPLLFGALLCDQTKPGRLAIRSEAPGYPTEK